MAGEYLRSCVLGAGLPLLGIPIASLDETLHLKNRYYFNINLKIQLLMENRGFKHNM